ncbi:antigen 5 like allergen Cul n 1-like [Culicoides brevitarsis]|uniref:antigen 5 like allergen Cul n 1-like n=1 Tax=Culicoides brevitarsis TaxID=469753 RepID=UPI00307C18FC
MKILILFFCAISATFAFVPNLRAKNLCPPNAKAIKIDKTLQALILEKHNTLRNEIAGGKIRGYKSAAAMAEMTWDKDLAKLAAKNAMTCDYNHDDYHETAKYPDAGQNLGLEQMKGKDTTDKAFIEGTIDNWWSEHKDANQGVIDSYHESDEEVDIGHFTVMANERSYKIGCAAVFYVKDKWNTRYLVCNYAMTNLDGSPVYKTGKPQSACKEGKSKKYKNLCSSA